MPVKYLVRWLFANCICPLQLKVYYICTIFWIAWFEPFFESILLSCSWQVYICTLSMASTSALCHWWLLSLSGLLAGVWSGRLFPTIVSTETAGPIVAELTGCNRQVPVCHSVPAKETWWAPVCTDNMSLLRMDSLWALLSLWYLGHVLHEAFDKDCLFLLHMWIKYNSFQNLLLQPHFFHFLSLVRSWMFLYQ